MDIRHIDDIKGHTFLYLVRVGSIVRFFTTKSEAKAAMRLFPDDTMWYKVRARNFRLHKAKHCLELTWRDIEDTAVGVDVDAKHKQEWLEELLKDCATIEARTFLFEIK